MNSDHNSSREMVAITTTARQTPENAGEMLTRCCAAWGSLFRSSRVWMVWWQRWWGWHRLTSHPSCPGGLMSIAFYQYPLEAQKGLKTAVLQNDLILMNSRGAAVYKHCLGWQRFIPHTRAQPWVCPPKCVPVSQNLDKPKPFRQVLGEWRCAVTICLNVLMHPMASK